MQELERRLGAIIKEDTGAAVDLEDPWTLHKASACR